ncbi:hypothetical protein BH09MYX1_BH09MYX1_06680 [soil metagenome]
MRRKRTVGKSARAIQLVSLVVAAILGILIFASKLNAQAAPPPPADSAVPIAAGPAHSGQSARGGVDAGALGANDDAAGAGSSGSSGAGGSSGVPDGGIVYQPDAAPIDYAVLQTDDDFPPDLSDEERRNIGTGKVPIHREGHYRSPFAHPRFGGPTTAQVGLVLADISGYDIQTGTFEADFFLSLTGDKEFGTIALTFTNGKDVTETVITDTPTFKLFRYHGEFVSPVDLRRYPFDRQSLTIQMEDVRAGVDQLILEPYQERTSLDEGFTIAGWGVNSVGAKSYRHMYAPRFDRDDLYVSRYKFTLGIERFATSAAFSVFVPAYIIVIISLFGIWVPPDELEVRTNAGAPMLAAAVLFHYSLIQSLPATGYLTRADKLMLSVYVSLSLNMAWTFLFLIVGEEKIERIFKAGRIWVPVLTVLVMLAGSAA